MTLQWTPALKGLKAILFQNTKKHETQKLNGAKTKEQRNKLKKKEKKCYPQSVTVSFFPFIM